MSDDPSWSAGGQDELPGAQFGTQFVTSSSWVVERQAYVMDGCLLTSRAVVMDSSASSRVLACLPVACRIPHEGLAACLRACLRLAAASPLPTDLDLHRCSSMDIAERDGCGDGYVFAHHDRRPSE